MLLLLAAAYAILIVCFRVAPCLCLSLFLPDAFDDVSPFDATMSPYADVIPMLPEMLIDSGDAILRAAPCSPLFRFTMLLMRRARQRYALIAYYAMLMPAVAAYAITLRRCHYCRRAIFSRYALAARAIVCIRLSAMPLCHAAMARRQALRPCCCYAILLLCRRHLRCCMPCARCYAVYAIIDDTPLMPPRCCPLITPPRFRRL